MAIFAVTGANGHGKGQLLIKKILDYHDENDSREKEGKPRRIIYTNIHGINEYPNKMLPDCRPLPPFPIWFGKQDDEANPPPKDYFLPPIGSVFIIDEAQEHEPFKQKSGALSKDPMVRSLETHRHAGFDVWFATQAINYLHSHIQGLIAPHYYVERPLGASVTNVFMFNKCQKSPESVTTKNKADDQTMIKLGKKYGQYYKSSAEHNMKATFPLKLKLLIGVFILVCIYTGYNFYNSSYGQKAIENAKQSEPASEQQTEIPIQDSFTPPPSSDQIVQEERQVKLEKYLPRFVVDTAYDEDIRVAGVVQMGDKCIATNSFGETLRISDSECKFMLSNRGFVPRSRNSFSDDDIQNDSEFSQTQINPVQPIQPKPFS